MKATVTNKNQSFNQALNLNDKTSAGDLNILPKRNPDYSDPQQIAALPNDLLQLLKPEAYQEMVAGNIPNLMSVCEDLYFTFSSGRKEYSALQFIPVLQKLEGLNLGAKTQFLKNPKTNHILVQNSLIKIVLIHWRPGHYSSIHGHAKGGCVFKVLSGTLEEKRYTPDANQKHLSTSTIYQGSMAYIDDSMAHHAVGNTTTTPAISIHAYTPGFH